MLNGGWYPSTLKDISKQIGKPFPKDVLRRQTDQYYISFALEGRDCLTFVVFDFLIIGEKLVS